MHLRHSHIFKTHGPLPGWNMIAGLGLPFLKINVGFLEKWVLFFYIDKISKSSEIFKGRKSLTIYLKEAVNFWK